MLKNPDSLNFAGYLLYLISGLIVFIGSLVAYIFQKHAKDNDRRFSENREDHGKIWDRLDQKKDKK